MVEVSPPEGDAPALPLDVAAAPASRRRGWLVVTVVVVALGAVGAGVAYLALRDTGPSHPDAWDPRVEDLVQFVEDTRDLDWKHPVAIDFLSASDFEEEVTADDEDLTDADRDELERATGQLRALGLVQGDVDLLDAINQLSGQAVLAFYDFESDRIFVRGTELDLATRGTVVHELTHALQDQHFDLDKQFDDPVIDLAVRGVVEGDASSVETAWVNEELDEQQRVAYEQAKQAEANEADLSGIPPVLTAVFGAPYALGEDFVSVVIQAEGSDAIDDILGDTLPSDEPLFDPFGYLDGETPEEVAVPELGPGEEETDDPSMFGVLSWYLVLASRIDATDALAAVDGWDGDVSVGYREGGAECARAVFRGDDDQAAATMERALDRWREAAPGLTVDLTRAGADVTLDSCDPGGDAELGQPHELGRALGIVRTRLGIGAQLLAAGLDLDVTACASTEIVQRLSIEEIIDPDLADQPRVQRIVQEIVTGCQ